MSLSCKVLLKHDRAGALPQLVSRVEAIHPEEVKGDLSQGNVASVHPSDTLQMGQYSCASMDVSPSSCLTLAVTAFRVPDLRRAFSFTRSQYLVARCCKISSSSSVNYVVWLQ